MKDFMTNVLAAMVGVGILCLGFALLTADTSIKAYCDNTTSDPFSQTGCIVRHTLT